MSYYIDKTGVEYLEEGAGVLLKWTTEPPTQAGWYWAFAKGDDTPIVIEIVFDESTGSYWVNGDLYQHPKELSDYWLGPLPVPEFPTK